MEEETKEAGTGQEELLSEAKSFFETQKKEIGLSAKKGNKVIYIDFHALAEHSPTLAENLILKPDESLGILELALEDSGLIQDARARLHSIASDQEIKIRNIRTKHLGKLISIEGIVRQASEVRPQVVNARFECPSCGTIISVLQMDKKFKEPSRCSCGRRGGFREIGKDMVDAQRLVIEESPDNLEGGEQPKRISVFLKEDLVEPKMEEKTTPGSRVKIIGILQEVAIPLASGALSTRYDLAIEANSIIPLEESFEELDISEEDEREIKELAADPYIFKKLVASVAPSIWGYDEIKESLVLQLFSGVKKTRSDGTQTRGDIHILLVGDPGVAKSIGKNEKILYFKKDEFGYESIENLFKKFGRFPEGLKTLTINMKTHKAEWAEVKEIIKHSPEKELIKVTSEHGKYIIATKDHSFITLSDEGKIVSIKGDELKEDSYLPIPINYHREVIDELEVDKFNTYITNSRQLPKKIKLNKEFGFFIGIFLSEGYIRAGKVVNISNENKKIKNKIIEFVKKLGFNLQIKNKEINISSKSLSNLLKFYCYNQELKEKINVGVKGNYSRIKKIPDFAYFAKKEFIKGLISGIFSGDGRFVKDKQRIKGFELITLSKELAHGTSDVLFSIGVLNRVIERNYNYKDKKTDYYIISISSQMIKKFRKNFNFYGRTYLNYSEPIYSYHNCIPCGELVYNLTKKLGYNKRIDGDRTFAAEMRTVRKRNSIGRLRLRRILKFFQKKMKSNLEEFNILNKIAYSPIIWSKIMKIEILKEKNREVYDLNIPKTNTFVANGLGVHNSVMLKFISGIAPKGRYVSGKSSSGAGLTATVVRDEFLRGWSLEAGAMVLSNKGLICIDELEKMDENDRSTMHESMEQQTVTISKANVQATLRSETSVLAAANPKYGRFDPMEMVAKQVDLAPSLLNRFDVIFILRDLPNKERDESIATHVLQEHKQDVKREMINKTLLRKYIAYSRQRYKPILTEEAVSYIKDFYVNLRNQPSLSGEVLKPIPISARQLEALIRLAEATARARLSKKVTKKDAEKAIKLMKFYLKQVGYDEESQSFDIDKISGIPASKRGKIHIIKEILEELESKLGKLIPIEEVQKKIEGKMTQEEFEEAMDKLVRAGDLFRPRKGYVQRM